MGCGGSSEVAPDPLFALLEEIDKERAILRELVPSVDASYAQLRYLTTSVNKVNATIGELQRRYESKDESVATLEAYVAKRDAKDIYNACAGFGADEVRGFLKFTNVTTKSRDEVLLLDFSPHRACATSSLTLSSYSP